MFMDVPLFVCHISVKRSLKRGRGTQNSVMSWGGELTNLPLTVICDVFEHLAAQNSLTSMVDTRKL